ncbi:MAG TPA: GDP-mannose 4,6-dehydratase, partial [candidate division Zixibacteria bacterium]|nr:GDP-mannose 4,6-dehydratase [candidate division Zixibacteria bacterium]
GVVAIFCGKLLNQEKVTIYGDGKQTRDYVFVDDVVNAFVSALDYSKSGVFNIGTGIETDVNQLYEILAEKVGSNSCKTYGPERLGEQKRSVIDFAKAKKELNWEPEVNLEQGLEKTIEYYQNKKAVLVG